MAVNLPPLPHDPISENFHWREWFQNLGTYIQQTQTGGTVWSVPVGGTGKSTFSSGYLKASGTSPFSSVATIPSTDITGLATVATSGNYTDLINKPSGYTGTITTAKLTTGGTNGSMTFTNGILTSQVAAT